MKAGIKRFVSRAVVSDAAKLIADPNNLGFSGSLLAKAGHVASELNALALEQPLSADLAPIDNSHEDPKDAELRLTFALGERLSLDFAYRDVAKQPRIIPLLEEDNVVRHYEILKLNSGHNGIVGNILIPAQRTDNARIYINFRGTQPHILSTVHLNFEHCAGEGSFYKHFNQIMEQLNDLIGQVSNAKGKPIQLIFSGHSLGGALSQHAHYAAMLLAARALRVDEPTQDIIQATDATFKQYLSNKYQLSHERLNSGNFVKVNDFVLHSWGMAGVSKTISGCSNAFADILQTNGKKIIGRFGFNTLDVVPRCGEANTLSDCDGDVACVVITDHDLNMTRSVVSGCIDGVMAGSVFGGAYGAVIGATTAVAKSLVPINAAHNNCHYGSYGELLANKEYTVHQNTNAKGKKAIMKAFDNKAPILQKPFLVKAKSVLQQVGDAGASLKQSATVGIVTTLKTIYRFAPSLSGK